MAMARELVTEKGIGERADQVWASLQEKQAEVFAQNSSQVIEPLPELLEDHSAVLNQVAPPSAALRLPIGKSEDPVRQKDNRPTGPQEIQLTLF